MTKTLLAIRRIIQECEDFITEEKPSDYAKDQERLNAYKQIVEEVTFKESEE